MTGLVFEESEPTGAQTRREDASYPIGLGGEKGSRAAD